MSVFRLYIHMRICTHDVTGNKKTDSNGRTEGQGEEGDIFHCILADDFWIFYQVHILPALKIN